MNTTIHTIKMKPINVKDNTYINKDNTYINIDKEVDHKKGKFKVGDRIRISKYKNIFAKGCTPN